MSAVIQSQFGPGTYGGDYVEPAAYDILLRDQRIAALEATVARLTAPVTEEEKRQFDEERRDAYELCVDPTGTALTAFLERRMRG